VFKARDIMTTDVVTVELDDTVDYAVSLLVKHRISGLPVLDKAGSLVGIISEFDLLGLICDSRTEKDQVCHYMSTELCKVVENDNWVSVADTFRLNHIRRLPVVRDDKLVGIIARHDLMRAIQNARRQIRRELSRAARLQPKLNCHLLLVEDASANERILSFVLKRAGADVTTAGDGQIALDKVLAAMPDESQPHGDGPEPFDIILMDMQMPVMDGCETTRRLREAGYSGPIIALTAQTDRYDRQKCLDAGCDHYLAKPVDRDKLVRTVAHYAEGQPQPTEATVPRATEYHR